MVTVDEWILYGSVNAVQNTKLREGLGLLGARRCAVSITSIGQMDGFRSLTRCGLA